MNLWVAFSSIGFFTVLSSVHKHRYIDGFHFTRPCVIAFSLLSLLLP